MNNSNRQGWKECKLGDIATYVTGKLNSNAAVANGGYPFFTCSPETLQIDNYAFDREALILAGNNADGVFSLKYYNGKFNAYQRTYIISVIDDKKTDYKFLFYSLKTQLLNLETISHGTATKYLTLSILNDIPVIIPSLTEQRAIAGMLSSLDDKIDLLHRQNKTLEGMAGAVYRRFFVEGRAADWKESTVNELAKHEKQSIHPNRNPETLFYHYSIPAFDESHMPISELGTLIQSNKYKVLRNTILFSKLNPHKDKRVWLIPSSIAENSISSTEFQVINPRSEKYLFFLYGYISYPGNYGEIAAGVGGTSSSHQRIDPEVIFKFPCFIPDDGSLSNYNEIVGSIFGKMHRNLKSIQTLSHLRDTLLPKLMSGEVRVKV